MAMNDSVNLQVKSYSFIGTILLLIGWPVLILCMTVFLTGSTGNDIEAIIIFVVFTLVACFLIFLGHSRKQLVKRFKRYRSIIILQHENTLARIATLSGIDSAKVQKDLLFMIEKSFFNKAYLDPELQAVIIKDRQTLVKMAEDAAPVVKPPEIITKLCNGCGSMNTLIKDGACLCEFCGSTISCSQA